MIIEFSAEMNLRYTDEGGVQQERKDKTRTIYQKIVINIIKNVDKKLNFPIVTKTLAIKIKLFFLLN